MKLSKWLNPLWNKGKLSANSDRTLGKRNDNNLTCTLISLLSFPISHHDDQVFYVGCNAYGAEAYAV